MSDASLLSYMTVSFSATYVKHVGPLLAVIMRFRAVMPCVSVYVFLRIRKVYFFAFL